MSNATLKFLWALEGFSKVTQRALGDLKRSGTQTLMALRHFGRRGSRTAATSKMKRFVIIGNG